MATRHVLADLAEAYERRSGDRVSIESAGGVDAARRVVSGEAFDVVFLSANAIDELASAGRVVAGSRTDVARSGVAIAVPAGRPHPDLGSELAVREAVMAARSIGFSTGPSGVHLARLLERWAITEAITPRLRQAPPGVPVGTLVARGEVELGFQQMSELIHMQGIEVAGALPAPIQAMTIFSGAVCVASTRRESAAQFLSFVASTDADDAKRRHGMEPAR